MFDIKDILTHDIIKTLIKEETLYSYTTFCHDCQNIEDDQYTCTSCWSQGGNSEISIHSLIKEAYKIKFENKEPDLWSLNFIQNLLQNTNIYFHLFDFDFKDVFPEDTFKEESYIDINTQDIYWFLFEK